jgi:predicted transcriptional regulator
MRGTKVELRTGSTEGFFNRLRNRASKLDRGQTVAPAITITFEDPADLLEVLTAERVRLLRQVKAEAQQVSALAIGLNRNVRAVSRDVSLLERAGLVRTSYRSNPGHGRLKLVEPVAQHYKLVANL